MIDKTHYVVGFLFSPDFLQVVLIHKKRPAWQAGKLNGVGGHVEEGETPEKAMSREFKEETGYFIAPVYWKYYHRMNGEDFQVDFFTVVGAPEYAHTTTDEKIVVYQTINLHPIRSYDDVVENLPWLVSLAIDHLTDGRPKFSISEY